MEYHQFTIRNESEITNTVIVQARDKDDGFDLCNRLFCSGDRQIMLHADKTHMMGEKQRLQDFLDESTANYLFISGGKKPKTIESN